MTAAKPTNRMLRWLTAGGLLAAFIDVLFTAWLGSLDTNYSHMRQFISELGETGRPHAAVFSIWCVLWGLLFAGFAVALARGLDGHKASRLGPGALLVVAACSILSAFFPCDPGCVGETMSARGHMLIGEISTVALVLAPFLAAIGMRDDEGWRKCRTFTLVIGVLMALVAGWLAVCHYADLGRSRFALGAAQRLFLGLLYVWVGVVAIRLWKLASAAERERMQAGDGKSDHR